MFGQVYIVYRVINKLFIPDFMHMLASLIVFVTGNMVAFPLRVLDFPPTLQELLQIKNKDATGTL